MKFPLLLTILLFSLLLMSGCHRQIASDKNRNQDGFTGDSGYIYAGNLLKKIKFDTIDSIYQRLSSVKNDTIGKYYMGNNGHYFSCLDASIGFPGFILVESLPDGTILLKKQFGVGINNCCWKSRYEGFKIYAGYISFRSCTTGTGICGGSIQLFNTLKAQDEVGSIVETMWYVTNDENSYSELTSKMHIRNDTVIMHYTAIEYLEQDNEKKIENADTFLVRYIDNNGAWTRLDSTKHVLGL